MSMFDWQPGRPIVFGLSSALFEICICTPLTCTAMPPPTSRGKIFSTTRHGWRVEWRGQEQADWEQTMPEDIASEVKHHSQSTSQVNTLSQSLFSRKGWRRSWLLSNPDDLCAYQVRTCMWGFGKVEKTRLTSWLAELWSLWTADGLCCSAVLFFPSVRC